MASAGLLVCSHRGPGAYRRSPTGDVAFGTGGPGGLIAVVQPALERSGGTWAFAPLTDVDRELAAAGRPLDAGRVRHEIVDIPPAVHADHYETVSTECLSAMFHQQWNLAVEPAFDDRFSVAWAHYRDVNERFGAVIARHAARGCDGVLVEDMHLMLAGAAARAAGPVDVPLGYFHHVPWCGPETFAILPRPLRAEILAGLLAHDVVAFHSSRWRSAFLACCDRFLSGARAGEDDVRWRGRTTRVIVAPAPVDPRGIRAVAEHAEAARWRERFEEECAGRQVVVKLERVDPAKNTLRGIEAFADLLRRDPARAERCCLLAVLTPVRQRLRGYAPYLAACRDAAARVNAEAGIEVVKLRFADSPHADDRPRAFAALGIADVHLVNSTFDGLNIVALEGAVLSDDAALVLSENTGAFDLLGPWSLTVEPFDVAGTADRLWEGLSSPREARRAAAAHRREVVLRGDSRAWIDRRLGQDPGPPAG